MKEKDMFGLIKKPICTLDEAKHLSNGHNLTRRERLILTRHLPFYNINYDEEN